MSQSSYANVLVVALLTCPVSSVVAEGLIPDNIIRSSHVMGPPSATAAYASVPIERSLKLNATSDANFSEDRAGFAALAADLQNLPSKVSLEVMTSLLPFRSSSNGFKSLKFEKSPDQLFANRKFLRWFNIVKSRYKEEPYNVYMKIYLILSDHCEDEAALTAFLYAESHKTNGKMRLDARYLLYAQRDKWKANRENAASVYKLLKLDLTQVDNPFDNLAFLRWALWVAQTPSSRGTKEAYEVVYEKLLIQCKYEDVAVAKALITGIKRDDDTTFIARKMAKYWLVEEHLAGKYNRMAAWYVLASYDASVSCIWDYYDKLCRSESKAIIRQLSHTFGDAKVACMLEAAKAMDAFTKSVQQLRKAQFDDWKEDYPGPAAMVLRDIPDKDLVEKLMDDYERQPILDAQVLPEPRR